MENDDKNRKAGSDCQERLVSGSSERVTIHNHEASGLWIAGVAFAFFGAIAAEKFATAWERVELEKIRAQQRVKIVEEAGNVSR